MRSRGAKVGALILISAMVAAGCGDDEEPSGTTSGATSATTASAATTAAGTSATTAAGTTAAAATTAAATTTASSEASTTAAGTETTAGSSVATTAPAGGQDVVTDFAAYVGGSGPADSSLSPIKVGYINQEGGAVEIGPNHDDGVEIGVKFINEQAGGIGGHPIELVKCYVASAEEEGQQCGQQFANDADIVAVVVGAVAIGAESMHAALAGSKPVVVGVSVNPVDSTQETAAILFGDAQYILAPYATFARDTLGTKSAALIYPEGAGTEGPAAGQASAFEAAGIPIKVVSYPANAPDLTVPLLAAGAQDVDLVMPVINPNDCVKFQQAIQQLNIPEEKVLASPICLTPTTIEGLGDYPKWIYAIASSLTFDVTDPSVPPYQEILKAQSQDALIGDPWVNVGFGQITTLAKWLNALGPDSISTDGIIEQMKAFRGPLALGSPVIECGKYPSAPGVCNDHTQFYKYNGADATPAPMTKAGDWVGPPEGWVAPA
jgi:branched-chain amino acid transport system substrate-binding protein